MIKSAILLGAACIVLVSIVANEASPAEILHSHWTKFKNQHGNEQFADQVEATKRFQRNQQKVNRFNEEQSQEAGYRLAVNHLANKTDEEFKRLLGFSMTAEQLARLQTRSDESSAILFKKIDRSFARPERIDWREYGRVSAVKDQGNCGSCWAFSVAGMIEGLEQPAKQMKDVISLSAQNIMDCGSYSSNPCGGGNTMQAALDVAKGHGIESESAYPYAATAGTCRFNRKLAIIDIRGTLGIQMGNESVLEYFVARYGPISVAIEVSDKGNFKFYKSGVYTDDTCHGDLAHLNHAVLVVGYGTDADGGDYWIVKNSWSDSWGDKGYIKMARNRNNMCGIASYGVLALL